MMPAQPPLSQRRFKTTRTVIALVLREMATTHGRSPGGYLWAIMEPVAGIALLTFIFSFAFRAPPLGTNFALFYATGVLPFMAYMDISQKVSHSIHFSRALLFYPGVTFVDALLARFILNTITQLMVFSIVMTGVIMIFDVPVILDFEAIFQSLAMAVCLGVGVGTLNCFLVSMYPAWDRIWAILNRPMFLIACIFFLLEAIPEPYRGILWYNPLVHITGEMRAGFYPTYDAGYVSMIYVFGISITCFLFGLVFLGRYHRDILNN